MARDRPPPNWSDSANSPRDFEGRERDGWSTDGSAHGGHVSSTGLPDVSDAGPETNAFLWALEGEEDPFSGSPVPQFIGQTSRVEAGQPRYERHSQADQRFNNVVDETYPEVLSAPNQIQAATFERSQEIDIWHDSIEYVPAADQQPHQDFYVDDARYTEAQYNDDPQLSWQNGQDLEGTQNRNVEPEQRYQPGDNHYAQYEDDGYVDERRFDIPERSINVDPAPWPSANNVDRTDSENRQVAYYRQPESSEEPVSSRAGFDDDEEPDPSDSFAEINGYDSSMSGQFSGQNYDVVQEYSREEVRFPTHENTAPPQHRESEQWFSQAKLEVGHSQRRSGFDSGSEVDAYRYDIERNITPRTRHRVGGPSPTPDPLRDSDYYDDEVINRPRRRATRQPSHSRRGAQGYVVEEKTKGSRLRDQTVEIVFLVVPAIILVLLVRSFIVSPFVIPTSSMEPTLEIGDRVLVNKLSYRVGDVGRGDLVVVRLDTEGEEKVIIKRAIGLPGETIEIRDNQVIIDGTLALEESGYLKEGGVSEDFGPVRVPPDELFLLGDNRENSDDSSKELGSVPVDQLIGRAFVRFWPMGRFGSL